MSITHILQLRFPASPAFGPCFFNSSSQNGLLTHDGVSEWPVYQAQKRSSLNKDTQSVPKGPLVPSKEVLNDPFLAPMCVGQRERPGFHGSAKSKAARQVPALEDPVEPFPGGPKGTSLEMSTPDESSPVS